MKPSLLSASLFAFCTILKIVNCDERIAFAYEMIRHGARAPGSSDPGYFKVNPGMLTASGMRQRYL